MASGPETVIVTTDLVGGGAPRQGANEVLLLGDHVQSGSLVSNNVLKVVKTPNQAKDFFGDGSDLHEAAKVALQNITRTKMVGALETNVASEVYGDSNAVEDSSDVGADVLQNRPISTVNSVTVDGGGALTVVYTHESLANMTPASGEITINTKTGEWKLFGGEGTSGAAAGVVFDYDYVDISSALEAAESSSYEYVAYANHPFNAQNYGIWDALVTAAATDNKVVAAALDSAALPADVEALVESIRSDRLFLVAADYSGDLTTAVAAHRASRPVNSTAKLQPAPRGISFTDTYRFSDYGGAVGVSGGPTDGTFHEMGVNAIFKSRGGAFLYSDSRTCTATTDAGNFADVRRIVRRLEVDLEDSLLLARRGSDTAIPYSQAGIEIIALTIQSVLGDAQREGLIDQAFLTVPDIDDFDANDRSARLMDGFDVSVRLTGQVHVISLDLRAEV